MNKSWLYIYIPTVEDAVAKFNLKRFRRTRFYSLPKLYTEHVIDRQASPSLNDRGPILFVDKTVMSCPTDRSFVRLKGDEAVVVFWRWRLRYCQRERAGRFVRLLDLKVSPALPSAPAFDFGPGFVTS